MKSTVAPYETSVKCLRIVCNNGLTIRLTDYPYDLTMSNSTVYKTNSGYEFTAYTAESGMAASAVDLQGIVDMAGVSRDALRSGVFDGARCYLFACNYLVPVEDYEPIVSSVLGKTQIVDDKYIIEEMALVDLLNQTVGDTYTAACRKTKPCGWRANGPSRDRVLMAPRAGMCWAMRRTASSTRSWTVWTKCRRCTATSRRPR